jgi:hypothetical protein
MFNRLRSVKIAIAHRSGANFRTSTIICGFTNSFPLKYVRSVDAIANHNAKSTLTAITSNFSSSSPAITPTVKASTNHTDVREFTLLIWFMLTRSLICCTDGRMDAGSIGCFDIGRDLKFRSASLVSGWSYISLYTAHYGRASVVNHCG